MEPQAATYADNEGRVKITSKSIIFGSRLAMHNSICPYDEGCPEMEMSMTSYATMRHTQYYNYISWESAHSEAIKACAPPPPTPDLPKRPAPMRPRHLPGRVVPWLRPLTYGGA